MTSNKEEEKMKSFCSNCSFKCQATECECLCHTQNRAFNYGIKEGKKIKTDEIGNLNPKVLAIEFHNTYEEFAKNNGWKTQNKCKVAFEDLPKLNKETMIDTCRHILFWLEAGLQAQKSKISNHSSRQTSSKQGGTSSKRIKNGVPKLPAKTLNQGNAISKEERIHNICDKLADKLLKEKVKEKC
jgi:hypothetical protein